MLQWLAVMKYILRSPAVSLRSEPVQKVLPPVEITDTALPRVAPVELEVDEGALVARHGELDDEVVGGEHGRPQLAVVLVVGGGEGAQLLVAVAGVDEHPRVGRQLEPAEAEVEVARPFAADDAQ